MVRYRCGRKIFALWVWKMMKCNLLKSERKSGLEIAEVSPKMSTSDALRTSIGQAICLRLLSSSPDVTTNASRGTGYQLSLLDK